MLLWPQYIDFVALALFNSLVNKGRWLKIHLDIVPHHGREVFACAPLYGVWYQLKETRTIRKRHTSIKNNTTGSLNVSNNNRHWIDVALNIELPTAADASMYYTMQLS